MSTIPAVSSSNSYAYLLQNKNTTQTTATQSPLAGVIATLGNTSSSSALTYNSGGLLNSVQKAASTTPATPAQTAQSAVLAAQAAVTQALGDIMSGSNSSNNSSSSTDIFGASTTTNDPLSQLTTSTSNTTAKTAQSTYMSAQDAVTKALNSIA